MSSEGKDKDGKDKEKKKKKKKDTVGSKEFVANNYFSLGKYKKRCFG